MTVPAHRMSPRAFRGPESLRAERRSRSRVEPLLASKGFTDIRDRRKNSGLAIVQEVSATAPNGQNVVFAVKLCWRRRGKPVPYTAAQLLASVPDGIAPATEIARKMSLRRAAGATHLLLVQPDASRLIAAVAIPVERVAGVWLRQYKACEKMLAKGALGQRTRNPAANGNSPTIHLQHDEIPVLKSIVDRTQGVMDLIAMPTTSTGESAAIFPDDTFDDLPVDPASFGSDSPERVRTARSAVKRDPRVRKRVIERASGRCERAECNESRSYVGFLDVHHVLTAEKSDREWTCVALCPNCHREAHFAPNSTAINEALREYADRFRRRPSRSS